jgi:hypothetical protein
VYYIQLKSLWTVEEEGCPLWSYSVNLHNCPWLYQEGLEVETSYSLELRQSRNLGFLVGTRHGWGGEVGAGRWGRGRMYAMVLEFCVSPLSLGSA